MNPSPYDSATLSRLQWAHGPERAASIAAGQDAAANADIEAWRSLGCTREAPDRNLSLRAQRVPVTDFESGDRKFIRPLAEAMCALRRPL